MDLILMPAEVASLMIQNPSTESDGGFQSLMVKLQNKLDPNTRSISLTVDELERIQRCAFKYNNGGWQTRLLAIFSRSLGSNLDRTN